MPFSSITAFTGRWHPQSIRRRTATAPRFQASEGLNVEVAGDNFARNQPLVLGQEHHLLLISFIMHCLKRY